MVVDELLAKGKAMANTRPKVVLEKVGLSNLFSGEVKMPKGGEVGYGGRGWWKWFKAEKDDGFPFFPLPCFFYAWKNKKKILTLLMA